MAYASVSQVRLVSGLTTSDISDADLGTLIPIADRFVSQEINTTHIGESLSGDIDGINKRFLVDYPPIGGDIDFDKTIESADVSVYYVTEDSYGNKITGSAQTVSSLIPRDGIIDMTTAPASATVVDVICDYSTIKQNIDWNLVSLASSNLCAHLCLVNLSGTKFIAGESYRLGDLAVTNGSTASGLEMSSKFYFKYLNILELLKSKPFIKVTSEGLGLGGTITGVVSR